MRAFGHFNKYQMITYRAFNALKASNLDESNGHLEEGPFLASEILFI